MSVDGIRDVPSTELLSAADLVVGEPWMQEWFHVAEGGAIPGCLPHCVEFVAERR
jgi:hypothetical protein